MFCCSCCLRPAPPSCWNDPLPCPARPNRNASTPASTLAPPPPPLLKTAFSSTDLSQPAPLDSGRPFTSSPPGASLVQPSSHTHISTDSFTSTSNISIDVGCQENSIPTRSAPSPSSSSSEGELAEELAEVQQKRVKLMDDLCEMLSDLPSSSVTLLFGGGACEVKKLAIRSDLSLSLSLSLYLSLFCVCMCDPILLKKVGMFLLTQAKADVKGTRADK